MYWVSVDIAPALAEVWSVRLLRSWVIRVAWIAAVSPGRAYASQKTGAVLFEGASR